MSLKLYFIAGESSGDMHGANLIKALRQRHSDIKCRGVGGDKMEAQGMPLLKHYKETSYMGFVEVLRHLGKILKSIRLCKEDINSWKPDAVVLIDYPGFNLRIAKWAHQKGIRVLYYISPQVWAWKQSRATKIKEYVDEMFCILPFEQDFYKRFGMKVHFVGHPLLDALTAFNEQKSDSNRLGNDKKAIAILPGSRLQEVRRLLPIMLEAARSFQDCRLLVAASSSVPQDAYRICQEFPSVELLFDQSYDILDQADAAVVASGTAALETALFGVPELVCYKGNPVSIAIARKLIKVPYISLVNLILDRPALTELIQNDCTALNIGQSLKQLLYDKDTRQRMKDDYKELAFRLGVSGASERCAEKILTYLATS